MNDKELAEYILAWIRRRNGHELDDAFLNISHGSFLLAIEELTLILKHGGKPPNWA